MILKFNDDITVSKINFYINYIIVCIYLIYIKLLMMLRIKYHLHNYIYKLCLFGGPIFIKIAQNISNKDNIDIDLKNKLLKFQDNNFDYCKDNYDSNYLKKKYNLDEISEFPIFAGSISCIYKCKYKNKKCILKIVHKNIEYKTILSINIFDKVINNLNTVYNFNQMINLNDIYKEVLNQVDLNKEYNNLMKIKDNFKNFSDLVIIPDVYYNDKNTLIESEETGYKFTEFIDKYPLKSFEAYYLLSSCFFKMFFDNFLHVDFHESNLRFKLENNKVKIVIYDFGMCSYLDDKKLFMSFLNIFKKNIFLPDPYKLVDFFIKLNTNEDVNIDNFRVEVYKIIDKNNYSNIIKQVINDDDKLNAINSYNIIQDMMQVANNYQLKVSDIVFNMLNSFILIEDFYFMIQKKNKNFYKSYNDRMKYAEENGFIADIKKNIY